MSTQSIFSILFWFKKNKVKNGRAPLYARVTVNGQRTDISTHREGPAFLLSMLSTMNFILNPCRASTKHRYLPTATLTVFIRFQAMNMNLYFFIEKWINSFHIKQQPLFSQQDMSTKRRISLNRFTMNCY